MASILNYYFVTKKKILNLSRDNLDSILFSDWRFIGSMTWMLLICFFVTIATPVSASDVSTTVTKLNYGVVLKPVTTVDIVTTTWRHTFIVKLPAVPSTLIHRHGMNCRRVSVDERQCVRLRKMVEYLHNITIRSVAKIHAVMRYIRTISPSFVPSFNFTRSARKRGLIDLGGDLLHGLFGTARDSDIAHVQESVDAMQKQNLQLATAWHETAENLLSFTETTNHRLDTLKRMINTQRHTIEHIFNDVVNETRDLTVASDLIVTALNRFEDFVLILDALEKFSAGVEFLAHGFLSPTLVSPLEIRNTINKVNAEIRALNLNIRVVRIRASFYYGSHHFLASRIHNTIMIHVPIPMTELRTSLFLYEVHVVPVPVPGNDNHATVLHNVPKFIAYRPEQEFFIEFEHKPDIKMSQLIYLEDTHGLMKTEINSSCILAILRDSKSDVHVLCDFTVLTNFIRPSLFIIDYSHVLITNMSNVIITCPADISKNITCPASCRVTIPCRCTLNSEAGYIPPRITGCIHGDVSLLHSVNLALLQNFFSESQLSHIWGNSLLPDPMQIFLPDLKIFEAEYSHELKEDKRARFDLKKIANLTKSDTDAFGSLAHSMVQDWRNYRSKDYENEFTFWSWKNWLSIGTSFIAVCALLLALRLGYRVRVLTATITTMQLPGRAYAAVAPSELNYFTTTLRSPVNTTWLNEFQVKYVPDTMSEMIIIFLLTLSVIFTMLLYLRFRRKSAYSFDLFLYVGCNTDICSLWIRSFALEPRLYTFSATSYIENLNVKGCLFPQLTLDWPSLIIRSGLTNENFHLPKTIKLSWSQRCHLRTLLLKPYWCILVINYKDQQNVVELPRRWESAPAYEGEGHSQSQSMPTLAPSLYPKLPTID